MFINNYIFSMVNRTEIVLSQFDHMLIRYIWLNGSGQDLDTSTGILNTGTSIDNTYVGFQQTAGATVEFVPTGATESSAYLWYALDNTSAAGTEAIVLGVNNIKNGVSTLFNRIRFPIMAHWWSSRASGNIQIELTTYRGGVMSITGGNNIINTGGVLVSTNTVSINVLKLAGGSTALSSFQHLATVTYDITLDSAVITPHGTPSSFSFSTGYSSGSNACSISSYTNTWCSYDSEVLGIGSVIFTNNELNVTVAGGNNWYKESSTNKSYQIDGNGNILGVYDCTGAPTGSMWTINSYNNPNLYFTRNYGTDTSVTVQTSTNSGASWINSTSGVVSPRDIGSLAAGTWIRMESTSDLSHSNVVIASNDNILSGDINFSPPSAASVTQNLSSTIVVNQVPCSIRFSAYKGNGQGAGSVVASGSVISIGTIPTVSTTTEGVVIDGAVITINTIGSFSISWTAVFPANNLTSSTSLEIA
jgi:hypothetical protein